MTVRGIHLSSRHGSTGSPACAVYPVSASKEKTSGIVSPNRGQYPRAGTSICLPLTAIQKECQLREQRPNSDYVDRALIFTYIEIGSVKMYAPPVTTFLFRKGGGARRECPFRGGPMKYAAVMLTVVFSLFVAAAVFAADDSVGNVKTVSGKVSIMRNNTTISPAIGEKIFSSDVLRTGPDSSIGVVFKDDTLVSLGPDSRLVITKFLFSPAENKLSIVLNMFRGTLVYLSGIIAKLAPEAVRIETPVASIGVRGTKFAVRVEGKDQNDIVELKAPASSEAK
jgi:hypothetical protein